MAQNNVQLQNGNGSLAGFRNLLINGLFTINQRNYVSGAATSGANQYTVDRWAVQSSGQNIAVSYSLGVGTITAPAGGVKQVIEGANILGGDYVLSWTGTASASINGSNISNGSSVTLAGGSNCTVIFTGGTVSKPQLEQGPVATTFEQRPVGVELALCQRYFYQIGSSVGLQGFYFTGTGGSALGVYLPVSTSMRAAPTIDGGMTQTVQTDYVNGLTPVTSTRSLTWQSQLIAGTPFLFANESTTAIGLQVTTSLGSGNIGISAEL